MIVGNILIDDEISSVELVDNKFVFPKDYTNKDFLKMLAEPFDILMLHTYKTNDKCGVELVSNVYDCISAELFTTKPLTKYHDEIYFLQDNTCELISMIYMLLNIPYKAEIFYSIKKDYFTTNLIDLSINENFEGNGMNLESSICDLIMKILDFYFYESEIVLK